MIAQPTVVFSGIPAGLRDPLLEEYRRIAQNFLERKWLPSGLSGGRFCEIVYTILDGFASGHYASAPNKPADFPSACKRLESRATVPRSFQILIPRLLPPLYEVRNNRGVGHVGGDVDPNHMDATVVLGMASWIMAELVRVLHQLPIEQAQVVVDRLVERKIPIVWQATDVKRVLDPTLKLSDQLLLLIASCAAGCATDELFDWTDYDDRAYYNKSLRELHSRRFVELSKDEKHVQMLPPGSKYVEDQLIPRENR